MRTKSSYSIGEVSQICNISRKTLRYYDTLQLVSSHRSDANNYRYYTYDELLRIPVIKYYKQMGFTLEEIRDLMGHSGQSIYSTLRNSFSEKLIEINASQEELRRKSISVCDWKTLVIEADQVIINTIDTISVKYMEAKSLLFQKQDFAGDMRGSIINLEWTNFIESQKNAITGPVIIHFSSHKKRLNSTPQSIHIMQEGIMPSPKEHTTTLGGCLMVSCYHIGAHEDIGSVYAKIYRWAKDNNYILSEDCYERYVADYWTTPLNSQFVTEVLVKISRKSLHSDVTLHTSNTITHKEL